MSSDGKPNACTEEHGAPPGRCGYTAAFARADSIYCGDEAAYEALNSRGRTVLLCVDHAVWARTHERVGTDLARLRLCRNSVGAA